MSELLSDNEVINRVFEHIDNETTDLGDGMWREPVRNYTCPDRFNAEIQLMRRLPIVYCPSASLPEVGSYVARTAAHTPLVAVRGEDAIVRTFRNACRHRGAQVAHGTGRKPVFVCDYHAWSYGLDGALRHIPHEQGFPDIEKCKYGLVPVKTEERGGLVFVTQEEPIGCGTLESLPTMLEPNQRLLSTNEKTFEANWKLNLEGNIEGYHIKPTHTSTFFPYGFDNLNVVETFGPNARVTYPFRRIEKLRNLPEEKRRIDGMVTFTHHLFPNVMVGVLSNHTTVSISEPLSPSSTRVTSYRFTNRNSDELDPNGERANRDAKFVSQSGLKEDADVVAAIQASLTSGANEYFTFGQFEGAIVHFHRTLTEMLAAMESNRTPATQI